MGYPGAGDNWSSAKVAEAVLVSSELPLPPALFSGLGAQHEAQAAFELMAAS